MTKVESVYKFLPSKIVATLHSTVLKFDRWSIALMLSNNSKVFLDTSKLSITYNPKGNISDRLKFEGLGSNDSIPCIDPSTGHDVYVKVKGSVYLLLVEAVEGILHERAECPTSDAVHEELIVHKSPLDKGKYTLEQLSASMEIPIELNYKYYTISPQERERAINYALDTKDFGLLKSIPGLKVKGAKAKYNITQGVLKPYWKED